MDAKQQANSSIPFSYGGREREESLKAQGQNLSAEAGSEGSKLIDSAQAKADQAADRGKALMGEAKSKATEIKDKVVR